jgi:hypothetical protein
MRNLSMKRTLSLLLLVAATAASAAPQKAAKTSPQKNETPAAPAVDPATREAATKARTHFRKMASLCPGSTCEPANKELIERAEKSYLEACHACSTEARCEEDRAKIRDNTSKRLGPCD